MSHIECVLRNDGWSDNEKALWLKDHMTRRAHMAYNLLRHEIQLICVRQHYENDLSLTAKVNITNWSLNKEREARPRDGQILGTIYAFFSR